MNQDLKKENSAKQAFKLIEPDLQKDTVIGIYLRDNIIVVIYIDYLLITDSVEKSDSPTLVYYLLKPTIEIYVRFRI